MHLTRGPSPGALRYPDHRIRIAKNDGRWTASIDGRIVADSRETLLLEESSYDGCVYFPPQDVSVDQLAESDKRTTCPFKGEAHYYAAEVDGTLCPVAWYYPAVFDEVAEIQGYIAFYTDHVNVSLESERGQD